MSFGREISEGNSIFREEKLSLGWEIPVFPPSVSNTEHVLLNFLFDVTFSMTIFTYLSSLMSNESANNV